MPTRPRLQIFTVDGFPEGMDTSHAASEVPDTRARYIQDGWVFRAPITDRRGPVSPVAGVYTIPTKAVALFWTTDPQGTIRIAYLRVSGTSLIFGVLSDDRASSAAEVTLEGTTWSTAPYPIVDVKPMLGGGVLVGVTTQDTINPSAQLLFMWGGANNVLWDTTVTVTQASKTVTGTGFSTNVTPGMFLFTSGGARYVGEVAKVDSNTSLTLVEPAIEAIAGAGARFKLVRGFQRRISKGYASVAAAATALEGANTKFRDEGATATDKVYRASDGLFVGTVATVIDNDSITLVSGATVALLEEEYFIIPASVDYSQSTTNSALKKPGFLSAVWKDRQWYLNRGISADQSGAFIDRLMFSGPNSSEDVDFSINDGDFISIQSGSDTGLDQGKALIPTYNNLVIFKERAVYAVYGDNEEDFAVRKLADDGTLSAMSVVPFESGVIWAGRNGIYFWDGVEPISLTEDRLGRYYHELVNSFDPKTYRMWATIHQDHYLLHIERVTPPIPVVKGNVSATPTQFTIAIYLPKRAITTHTNLNMRGSISLPTGEQWYLVNSATQGRICDVNTLFEGAGTDAFGCDGGAPGPDLYIESKKYDIQNALVKKLWKMIMLHYLVGGDSLRLDTVLGLNDVGSTTTSEWPITVYTWDSLGLTFSTWDNLSNTYPTWDSVVDSIFFVRRIKFLKRNQYFAFRLYQDSAAVTEAKLGPFALGFKRQREGRV